MSDLRYPIGKYQPPAGPLSDAERRQAMDQIAGVPAALRQAVDGLADVQLDTPYRPEGWTVRQVVHHVPDSHLNAYVRFKLALTEDEPTIKPYLESAWATLPDTRQAPIELSLSLLAALHGRWNVVLETMTPQDFARTFRHPELGVRTLDATLGLYSWHGRHHVAHITGLRERMGWS